MKLSSTQMDRMVKLIFSELKSKNLIVFKEKEEKVFVRAVEVIRENIEDEKKIDVEAERMVVDLERTQKDSFQRHKMFQLIKKELAKKKGFIL